MTIVVFKADNQPFRFSCQMSLEDEDQLRAVIHDNKPHNIEICAKDLWALFTAPNGATILVKQKEHSEPA